MRACARLASHKCRVVCLKRLPNNSSNFRLSLQNEVKAGEKQKQLETLEVYKQKPEGIRALSGKFQTIMNENSPTNFHLSRDMKL